MKIMERVAAAKKAMDSYTKAYHESLHEHQVKALHALDEVQKPHREFLAALVDNHREEALRQLEEVGKVPCDPWRNPLPPDQIEATPLGLAFVWVLPGVAREFRAVASWDALGVRG